MPTESTTYEIKINIERYLYALQFCKDKVVMDASCGAGLGSYLYSLQAKKVIAVDLNDTALEYAKKYPHSREIFGNIDGKWVDQDKIEYIKKDLEKDELPEADICVSMETIEHLDGDYFLKNLKAKELVFSVPLNSKSCSQFHKKNFITTEDILNYIKQFYQIEDFYIQTNRWVIGKAKK